MSQKMYQMKLNEQELAMVRAYRRAVNVSEKYLEIDTTANVFVGTPSNCMTVNDAIAQVEALQSTDPDLALKAFIVPASDNPEIAHIVRQHLLHVVEDHLEQGFPDPSTMN